jgi:hypothetical protein
MARRRPAQLRAEQRRPQHPLGHRSGRIDRVRYPTIPGLSPAGNRAIEQLEHRRFWWGAVAHALRWWTGFVRNPYHRLYDRRYEGCGIEECCPDPGALMEILQIAAHHLPPKDARRLRQKLAEIDDLW